MSTYKVDTKEDVKVLGSANTALHKKVFGGPTYDYGYLSGHIALYTLDGTLENIVEELLGVNFGVLPEDILDANIPFLGPKNEGFHSAGFGFFKIPDATKFPGKGITGEQYKNAMRFKKTPAITIKYPNVTATGDIADLEKAIDKDIKFEHLLFTANDQFGSSSPHPTPIALRAFLFGAISSKIKDKEKFDHIVKFKPSGLTGPSGIPQQTLTTEM